MSDNGTHETNENYNGILPEVENEEEVDVDGSGPIVPYNQAPAQVIPDRHKMVEILTPDEEKENMENGEGSKRKNEPSAEFSTPAAKRMRGDYEYTPHRDMYSEEFVRSSEENSILQKVNSKLRELGRLAEANNEANEKGVEWMNTYGLAMENIQSRMVDDHKYHQRKFFELYNSISGMWGAVREVKEKVEKVESKQCEIKNETYKIKTLIKDTRRIIMEKRSESTSRGSRAPTPDYQSQPLSPSFVRQEGNGNSAVRLQGFRTPLPMSDHHQAQVHSQVSPQDTDYPVCVFCDTNLHLPEHCNIVSFWQDRRSIVTQKQLCCLCLGPMHDSEDACPQKGTSCSGCSFKFFNNPKSADCHHHVALCMVKKNQPGANPPKSHKGRGGRGGRGRGTV